MAMPIIMFPSLIVSSISSLLVPEFTRYHVKKDYKKADKVIKFILITIIIFSLFLTIIFFVFADKLALTFYNSLDAGIYINFFAFLIIFMYLDIAIDSILKGFNAHVSVMIINILDLAITVILTYLLVPRYRYCRSYYFYFHK